MARLPAIIDDLGRPWPEARNGARWELVSDGVMGGRSAGQVARHEVAGRAAIHMTGQVSLENNGGFLQIALDLAPDGSAVDASGWAGIELNVFGTGEGYNLHLRTSDVTRPWQSYRQSLVAHPRWQTLRMPFSAFATHRIDRPFDVRALRRIGLVAIGRAFRADVALAGLRFYG